MRGGAHAFGVRASLRAHKQQPHIPNLLGGGDVTAPPARLARLHDRVVLHALDKNQQLGVGLEHARAEPLGGEPPVGRDAAVAPARAAVRLVVEVGAKDVPARLVAFIYLFCVFRFRV